MKREELELEKLELEIARLRQPQHKTWGFWLGLFSAMLALAGIVVQDYLTKIESANAKYEMSEAKKIREKAEADTLFFQKEKKKIIAEKSKLVGDVEKLVGEKERLEEENSGLYSTNKNLRKANEELAKIGKSQTTIVNKSDIIKRAENAKYSIGFYALGVKDDKYRKIKNWLTHTGYSFRGGSNLNDRVSWLASKPTVLYYTNDTTMAHKLAEDLRAQTGIKFAIQRGAGLGVGEGEEQWVYYIHMVIINK